MNRQYYAMKYWGEWVEFKKVYKIHVVNVVVSSWVLEN